MALPTDVTDVAQAQKALHEGRTSVAIELAGNLTTSDPEDFEAWQVLGIACAVEKRMQEALSAFTRCVELRPNLPQAHFNLAQELAATGHRQEALAELAECLELDHSYRKASEAMRALQSPPEGAWPAGDYPVTAVGAEAALHDGRIARAIEIAEAITAKDPEDFDAWHVLGTACAVGKKLHESLDAYTRCVRLRPNLPQAHFNLAEELIATGNRERALDELEECLSLDHSYKKASEALRVLSRTSAGAGETGIEPIGIANLPGADFAPTGPQDPGLVAGHSAAPLPHAGLMPEFEEDTLPEEHPGLGIATYGWAASAIGLAGLYLYLQKYQMLAALPAGDTMNRALGTASMVVACALVAGALGLLLRRHAGRYFLIGAAGAAAVLSLVVGSIIFNVFMNEYSLQKLARAARAQATRQAQQMAAHLDAADENGESKTGGSQPSGSFSAALPAPIPPADSAQSPNGPLAIIAVCVLLQLIYSIQLISHLRSDEVEQEMLS